MTTQTVELDPETGLAALPEGYFWRVVPSARYLTLTLIRIDTDTKYRGKWLFFGSEEYTETTEFLVTEEYYDTHQHVSQHRTKEAISSGLSQLSKIIYLKWRNQREQWELLKGFGGDYPPKNLNSV